MIDSVWENLKSVAWNAVWAVSLTRLPPWRAGIVRYLRAFHLLARELAGGHLNVRAASLVYTTLLSLVPVLAVSFSVLKAFDVHYRLTPMLIGFLDPLGEQGVDIGVRIVDFVENVSAAKLGSLGVVVLLFTVVSLLQKIEHAFNYTWRIERPRRLAERFSSYLTVVLIGPVLVITAIGVTASITGHELYREALSIGAIGWLVGFGAKLVPYLLVVAAFTFVYVYIPNTKVRLRSALVGAVVAGVLWETAGWVFAALVVGSTRYTAIYSSFAILVLFMMWVYLGWLILLAGASVAFYHQNPEYLGAPGASHALGGRSAERVAVAVCYLVARNHRDGAAAWSDGDLARRLGVPLAALEPLLSALEQARLLAPTAGPVRAWLPGRDPASTRLSEPLSVARSLGEARRQVPAAASAEAPVDELMNALEMDIVAHLGERTLADLVDDGMRSEASGVDAVAVPIHPRGSGG